MQAECILIVSDMLSYSSEENGFMGFHKCNKVVKSNEVLEDEQSQMDFVSIYEIGTQNIVVFLRDFKLKFKCTY